jgi:hypothetical protein
MRFHRGDLPTPRPKLYDEDWVRIDLPHDFLYLPPWTHPRKARVPTTATRANIVRSR